MQGYDTRGLKNIVLHNGDLFTNEMYLSENLFQTERELEFVFNDATTFMLPPQKDFQLTATVTLRKNKLEDWNINIEGLESKYLFNNGLFDLETVRLFTWELALISFGYQVDLSPFEYSDDGYKFYLEELERINDGNIDLKPLTKTEIKSLQLAVDYLHLSDFFQNQRPVPMYLANRDLIRDWEAMQTFLVRADDQKLKKPYSTKKETTERALRRIPQELFIRSESQKGKTSYTGVLTANAIQQINFWIRGSIRNTTELKGHTLKKKADELSSWITTEVKS